MRRRDFITILGGAAVWPVAGHAQQPQRMRRIGVLMAVAENDPMAQPWVTALQERLEKLGWQVGRNLRIEYRWTAGNFERTPTLAAELVSLNPDVLLAGNNPTAAALHQATRNIPTVFVLAGDPVAEGWAASWAHPGGNITGFVAAEDETVGKRLQLLKEIAPGVRRVAFIFNPEVGRYAVNWLLMAEAYAPSLGMEIIQVPVHNAAEIESAMTAWGHEANAGLNVNPDITTLNNRQLIAELAAKHRLPAVYAFRFFVTSGGLISYGSDITEEYRQAAQYIDRILKGATPGELPVQAPTRYEMVINLKAAKVLGLTVPPLILLHADEVIE